MIVCFIICKLCSTHLISVKFIINLCTCVCVYIYVFVCVCVHTFFSLESQFLMVREGGYFAPKLAREPGKHPTMQKTGPITKTSVG